MSARRDHRGGYAHDALMKALRPRWSAEGDCSASALQRSGQRLAMGRQPLKLHWRLGVIASDLAATLSQSPTC